MIRARLHGVKEALRLFFVTSILWRPRSEVALFESLSEAELMKFIFISSSFWFKFLLLFFLGINYTAGSSKSIVTGGFILFFCSD